MKDFYYILGTDTNCSFEEIKEAYRKLSKKFHPDLNPEDKYFESRFREIQEAYETLSDPIKRARYDVALRKSKSDNPLGDQRRYQYYNEHKSAGKHHQTTTAIPNQSRTKAVDIIFSVLLIFITLVFANYVYKSMTGDSKPAPPKIASVVTPVSYLTTKHHKKHHLLRLQTNAASPIPTQIPNKVSAAIKSSPIIKPDTQRPEPVQTTPIIAVSNKTSTTPSFLYATYIKANMTGLVNMRESGNFGADVIASIPNNSRVFVIEKGNTYYKVVYNNVSGYVPKWSLGAR